MQRNGMMMRQRSRARACGRQGCDCCNGLWNKTLSTITKRRVRRREEREWRKESAAA